MRDLHSQFGEDVDLASEREIDELFSDCVHGAVPPIGECYGLDMIVDDSIDGRVTSIWRRGTTRRSCVSHICNSPS